jgi:hypothetical protein
VVFPAGEVLTRERLCDVEIGPVLHLCSMSSIYRVGDTVVFKYEGNVRATVEGSEVIGGRVWLRCRAALDFEVPASQVVGVERESE